MKNSVIMSYYKILLLKIVLAETGIGELENIC